MKARPPSVSQASWRIAGWLACIKQNTDGGCHVCGLTWENSKSAQAAQTHLSFPQHLNNSSKSWRRFVVTSVSDRRFIIKGGKTTLHREYFLAVCWLGYQEASPILALGSRAVFCDCKRAAGCFFVGFLRHKPRLLSLQTFTQVFRINERPR